VQIILFPAFGIDVGMGQNIAIGLIVTVSMVRSYALRRMFEAIGLKRR
jgi:hypothetical protein